MLTSIFSKIFLDSLMECKKKRLSFKHFGLKKHAPMPFQTHIFLIIAARFLIMLSDICAV